MRKIAYDLDIGYCGCNEEGVTTVEDHMSNEDIDAMINDMAFEHAQSWAGDERLQDYWDEQGTADFYEGVGGSWKFVTEDEHG